MKSFLLLPFIFFGFIGNATNYYISSASGNDANAGTSTGAPWQTIAKFNSVFASKSTGDNFLFNRGDVFYGSLVISRSGSAGLPITIGAYGSGANPIITGFSTISSWTNLGSNIWESTSAISKLSTCNMVVINGANTPMGRYPNIGYLTYQSYTGTSITSSSLNSAVTNWTGAESVIRKNNWIINRATITSQSGGTINYVNPSGYYGTANYGFFIQNDSRTLDVQNEWYYNPSTKKIRIYSTSSPTNVQVATRDTLVYVHYKSYITFDNISFIGSNKDAFVINSSPNIIIQNCSIDFSGVDAIWGNQNWGSSFSPNFQLLNSTINHTNSNAISLASEFYRASIQGDTIKNTGMIAGMASITGDPIYVAIKLFDSASVIQNCFIDSTGYVPIHFLGNNVLIHHNFITNYDMVKMDGGGIYTWLGANTPNTGCKIYNNIIINASGSTSIAGTTQSIGLVEGIYLDANTANMEVYNNTCANLANSGIYLWSGASNNNVHDNTSYNNKQQVRLHDGHNNGQAIVNNILSGNIFFSKDATQFAGTFETSDALLSSFTSTIGMFTNNYYARPIDDNLTISTLVGNTGTNYTLAQWKTISGKDVGSNKSPKTITDVNDLRFEYNATSSNKTVSLPYNYIDVKNVPYNGTITLAPYTSAVLIKIGAKTN